MRVFAGCDGGGTKCDVRIVLSDEGGAIIAMHQATSGPANVSSDPDLALRNIKTATTEAMRKAGLDGHEIDRFVLALAGAGKPAIQRHWQRQLANILPASEVVVVPDVTALFAAADVKSQSDAIALIIGTGSIVWARHQNGTVQRAGGRGSSTGDEGSGFWIGREAIRRLEKFSKTPASHRNPKEVASLAREVFAAAATNDLARQIIAEAALHITNLVLEAGNEIKSSKDSPVIWLCAGGVAVHQPAWMQTIRSNCLNSGLFLQSPTLIREPVAGALHLAMGRLPRTTEKT